MNQKEVGAVRSYDEAFPAVEQEISVFFDRSGGGSEKIRSAPSHWIPIFADDEH
jgi:hypothetical protein